MKNFLIGSASLIGSFSNLMGFLCTVLFALHYFNVLDFKVCVSKHGYCSVSTKTDADTSMVTSSKSPIIIAGPQKAVAKAQEVYSPKR